jgi:hypothetical protein
MKMLVWLLVLAALGAVAYTLWTWRQRWLERKRAAEERMASFIAEVRPAVAPPAAQKVDQTLPQQRLLFDAAAKAGEAGEPALAIELYGRLLARFPQSAFAAQARAAIDAQKQRLAKA